jgi:succinyl-CoA synthetase beta subunit
VKIHEYQAAELLRQYGVETGAGRVAFSAGEAEAAARELGGCCVLKAQVHTGGRGKAGGIKMAASPEEAGHLAEQMLGKKLVTRQTGPEGKLIRCLSVVRCADIVSEYYLSFTIDGARARIIMLASSEGGTEIEETAQYAPEKIIREPIDITIGLRAYQTRRVAECIGLKPALYPGFVKTALNLYRLFVEKDCSLVEINPLAETADGRLMAVDAKLDFDQNAVAHHEDIRALRDVGEEDPLEVEASKYGLSYISMDGNIGCMVNGAGLAMATMDIIRHVGGAPANFLDVGGSASAEKVAAAFRILLSDKKVKGILINIFGGIMKCDVLAQGILEAAKTESPHVPVVVRLEGTNVGLGREILQNSGLRLQLAESMLQAAQSVVALANGREAMA